MENERSFSLDIETDDVSSKTAYKNLKIKSIAIGQSSLNVRNISFVDLKKMGNVPFVGHNMVGFDYRVLKDHGVDNITIAGDTLVKANYVCKPSELGRRGFGQKQLCYRFFRIKPTTYDDAKVDPVKLRDYNCEDVEYNIQIDEYMDKHGDRNQLHLYEQLEVPLLTTLSYRSISVNSDRLDKLFIENKMKFISAKAELGFNPNSAQQIKRTLQEVGVFIPDTEEKTLKSVKNKHPLVSEILDAKRLYSHVSSLKTLQNNLNDGQVSVSFAPTTATGRMKTSNPNIQGLKSSSRDCIVPAEGNLFVVADFGQIEIRTLAALTKDPNLIADLNNLGADIYLKFADVFGFTHQCKEERRNLAKVLLLGLNYGMSPRTIANNLNVSLEDVREMVRRFYLRYEKVDHWNQSITNSFWFDEFVKTHYGRKLWRPASISEDQSNRIAKNYPNQGTCADLLKLSLLNLKDEGLLDSVRLLIHDEIVIEVPKKDAEDAQKTLLRCMLDHDFPCILTAKSYIQNCWWDEKSDELVQKYYFDRSGLHQFSK